VTTEPLVPTDSRPRSPSEARLSTFLLTDVEGSTRLWEDHPVAMRASLATHDRLLRDAVAASNGTIVKTTGDGILAIFGDPVAAIDAAIAGQRALRDAIWETTGVLRVRMALHAGTAESRDGDYFGPALNRVSRILAIGHGGQILCSAVVAVLAQDRLPARAELVDLGSHRLRDLDRSEEIFQVLVPDLARAFPPLRSLSTRRSNLPIQLTSFVGRERELDEVASMLARHRLVTLVGVGGTGKTRLMLEAGARIADRFRDGTWLAELAPLTDPSQLASEVARAVGAPEIQGVPALQTVASFLAEKEVLLLLDNAEHLVDGVASLAERLLGIAPELRIMTTSREALAVPGEAVLQLPSLTCPSAVFVRSTEPEEVLDVQAAASTEAVRLFAERAASVDPAFAVDRANIAAVAEICRRLDGIPLAIELAAARVSTMSPEEIARRLGDRFRLLAGGRRTAVPRQQTLHALIDWSWDLLTDDDRRLLRRLSVFAGGWTAAEAAAVVGDSPGPIDEVEVLDALGRLVDRSLVIVDHGPTTRFRMLETIRQYAREKLIAADEVATVADRHFIAFAVLASEAEEPIHGPLMVEWLDRLDADQENLVAALEWGLEAQPWAAVRMARALVGYWAVRVMSQDNDARLTTAIEIARRKVVGNPDASRADQVLAASLLGEAARLWAMSGRAQAALSWAQDAMALAISSEDDNARLYASTGLGMATTFAGAAGDGGAAGRELLERNLELAERTGRWWLLGMAAAFAGAGSAAFDRELGLALLRRGVEAATRSGNPQALAAVAMAQGRALSHLGDAEAAAASFEVAMRRFQQLGDERFVLAARSDMAHALRRGGRRDEARAMYRETIGGWVHLGHRGAIANQLENVAYLEIDGGRPERAARLLGAAAAIREATSAAMAFDERPEFEAFVGRLAEALDPSELATATAAGRSLSLREAVALATAA
jgi:predicted ATPase/class 3 adenylate cyclase